jgi:hypothetical protein
MLMLLLSVLTWLGFSSGLKPSFFWVGDFKSPLLEEQEQEKEKED